MEGPCNLFDSLHNCQVLLPEAERNGSLGDAGKSLEKLDELPVLELQGRSAPLVLTEQMQCRRLESIASERDAEWSAKGEEVVEGPVAGTGNQGPVLLQRGLSLANQREGQVAEPFSQVELIRPST